MRYSEPKRTDEEIRRPPHPAFAGKRWRPSGLTIAVILLVAAALVVMAFLAGYIPLQKREALLQSQAAEQDQAVPRVQVIRVERSSASSELELPGSIQAVTEAPILARADGYLKRRLVDIGDRVRAGQPLAEIEAPELDQQVRQAQAALDQAKASLEQAVANREQGKANLELARVTADRWKNLMEQGIVSRQDNDQYQAQFAAQTATVNALDKAVEAQRSNVAAAEANLARLNDLQAYRVVTAPFDGVITLRNVDVGALVVSGNTLLYRIAQTALLRTYVNVPQANADLVHTGQSASVTVSNLPGRRFSGTVAHTADALDPASRTMLVEIDVPNQDGALFPGMYAQVNLLGARSELALFIPAEALIYRAEGTQVAVVRGDETIHLQKVTVARDYGDKIEISDGIRAGETIVASPTDATREGMKIDVAAPERSVK